MAGSSKKKWACVARAKYFLKKAGAYNQSSWDSKKRTWYKNKCALEDGLSKALNHLRNKYPNVVIRSRKTK